MLLRDSALVARALLLRLFLLVHRHPNDLGRNRDDLVLHLYRLKECCDGLFLLFLT